MFWIAITVAAAIIVARVLVSKFPGGRRLRLHFNRESSSSAISSKSNILRISSICKASAICSIWPKLMYSLL